MVVVYDSFSYCFDGSDFDFALIVTNFAAIEISGSARVVTIGAVCRVFQSQIDGAHAYARKVYVSSKFSV